MKRQIGLMLPYGGIRRRPYVNLIASQNQLAWLHNKSFARRFGVLYYVFVARTRTGSRTLSHSRVVSSGIA